MHSYSIGAPAKECHKESLTAGQSAAHIAVEERALTLPNAEPLGPQADAEVDLHVLGIAIGHGVQVRPPCGNLLSQRTFPTSWAGPLRPKAVFQAGSLLVVLETDCPICFSKLRLMASQNSYRWLRRNECGPSRQSGIGRPSSNKPSSRQWFTASCIKRT